MDRYLHMLRCMCVCVGGGGVLVHTCACVCMVHFDSGLGREKETEVRVRERQRVGYTVSEVRTIDSDEVRENKAAHFLVRGGRWPGQTCLRLVFVAEVWPS